ncbi:tyrosine-type recombinase/integrase [Nonomuraea angiospora]
MSIEPSTPAGAPVPVGGPRVPQRKRRDERDPRLPLADLFSPSKAQTLWESLPDDHRQDHFDSKNMPADYAQAFRTVKVGEGGQWTSQAVSMRRLPREMIWELAWFIHHEVADGHVVNGPRLQATRIGLELVTQHGTAAGRAARSVMAMSVEDWVQEIRRARMRLGKGEVGAYVEDFAAYMIKRIQDRLVYAYHEGPWWQLNVWNPMLDPRIPLREHEPQGRHRANFSQLTSVWLREACKWWLSTQLINGHYVWSSIKSRLDAFKWFQWYLDEVGCAGPHLVDDVRDLRPLTRGFVESLRQHTVMSGPNKGGRLAANGLRQPLITVETFYRWMFDNAREAVVLLEEPRWLRLTSHHTVLFRPEDKPRQVNKLADDLALEEDVVNQIAAGSELLALPKNEGGIGDVQAFHALMLQIRTGRRMSEILLMDFEPLSPLPHSTLEAKASAESSGGFVARLAYQQTKIETSQPATIPVDAEIVAIIRAQQEVARQMLSEQKNGDGVLPRYLFLRSRGNRLGRYPYPAETYQARLRDLTQRLNVTDSMGRPVHISKTHRFRHTRATDLINAGVPIHVVMRYFGHLTPAMTMHYAKTRSEAAEREFLRYKKITADGRVAHDNPSDMFDLLHLDQRADRILPNGWCLLPPKQVCAKGNACLTCDKFVTDAGHRDELRRQLDDTEKLISRRQAQFTARHGEPMSSDNVWLSGRTAEITALRKVLIALDEVVVRRNGQAHAVRGAGTPDRPDPISEEE